MDIFRNTHVYLTGASRGLGAALYGQLKEQQAKKVSVICRSCPEKIRRGDEFIPLDLSVAQDFSALPMGRRGDCIFVSNAGRIGPIGHVTDNDDDDLTACLNVNFNSPMRIAAELARRVRGSSGRLYIVNITSGAALRPVEGWSAYCTSKAAVRMGFDCLREEMPEVMVMHIDPGVMDTAMQKEIRRAGPGEQRSHSEFVRLSEQGLLLAPATAAKQILRSLEDWICENSDSV